MATSGMRFPLAGGEPSLIRENIKPVGLYWWRDKNTLAFHRTLANHTPCNRDCFTVKADLIIENPGLILLAFHVRTNHLCIDFRLCFHDFD